MTKRTEDFTNDDYLPGYYDARPLNFEEVLVGLGVDLENFYYGNIIKYLYRYPYKGLPTMDLVKARTYLNLLISVVEEYEESTDGSKETK